MRKRWPPAFEWLHTALAVVVVLVSMPVAIPVAFIQHGLTERRKRRRVETARCARCTAILGATALTRSDADWTAHWDKLHRENPGVKFRMVRPCQATCTACGFWHRYDEQADAFVAAED